MKLVLRRCLSFLLFLSSWTWQVRAGEEPVAPAVPALPGGFDGRQPQLAADARDHSLYLVVGQTGGAIYCARSADDGRTFAAPIEVATLPGLALGLRRGPRIAADGGKVTITAISHETGQLVAYHSSDQGQTWSGAACINQGADKSAGEGLHAMAVRGRDGLLFVAWLDSREKGNAAIYGSSSADGGATWSANRPVYRSPDGHVCECCQPTAVFGDKGTLTVMWRNWLGGSRDLYTAISNDGGQTFGSAIKQGQGTWKLNACPMDGGAVVALPAGGSASVWQRAGSVYLARGAGTAASKEQLLGRGTQPVAVVSPEGAVVTVWQERGQLFAERAASDANAAAKPQPFAGPDCSFVSLVNSPVDGQPVAAWEVASTGGNRRVFVGRVP